MRPVSIVFFVVLFGIVASGCVQAANEDEKLFASSQMSNGTNKVPTKECKPTIPPAWPLKSLDKKEKEARLRFFLKQYDFKVKEEGTGSEIVCGPLLKQLKTMNEGAVLEKVQRRPENMNCKNIKDMTQYFSWKDNPLPSLKPDDKESYSLSPEEKEDKADLFYRPTTTQYIEYYDLSRYFGSEVWGVLAEAVAVRFHPRHAQKLCISGWDSYRQAGILGRVFDPNTCSAYFIPVLASSTQRLLGSGNWIGATPSFATYVEIDQKLYMLNFITSVTWNEFSEILNGGFSPPEIMLTPLLAPNTVTTNISHASSCLYVAERN